jgi:stage III sporulation protein AG
LDQLDIPLKIKKYLDKYKFPLIIFSLGILFILLSPVITKNEQLQEFTDEQTNILSVEEQLEMILSSVKGAGKVQVMLSITRGEETLYQTDQDQSINQDKTSTKIDTVTVTDSDRNEVGLVKQVNPPHYSGAVVVCQGANNPNIKLSIIDAVSKLTGLGTDKIAVLEMK